MNGISGSNRYGGIAYVTVVGITLAVTAILTRLAKNFFAEQNEKFEELKESVNKFDEKLVTTIKYEALKKIYNELESTTDEGIEKFEKKINERNEFILQIQAMLNTDNITIEAMKNFFEKNKLK